MKILLNILLKRVLFLLNLPLLTLGQTTLILSGNATNGTKRAVENIQSNQVINPEIKSIYQTARRVVLTDGFFAKSGSVFSAEIKTNVIQGRIISTQNNIAVANASIYDYKDSLLAITDINGCFILLSASSSVKTKIKIMANGYITRITYYIDIPHSINIDIIENIAPFSLDYYGQLVFRTNTNFSLTDRTPPIPSQRWNINPKIYVKTTFDIYNNGAFVASSSQSVPQVAIDKISQSLPIIFQEVTQGKIQMDLVEFGADLRHNGEAGWIIITFFDRTNNSQNFSGLAANSPTFNGGITGGVVLGVTAADANYPYQYISAGLCFHEMGHCLGLGHTTNVDPPNMMAGGSTCLVSDTHYSNMERYHAKIMYSRPRGNTYPDTDPDSFWF